MLRNLHLLPFFSYHCQESNSTTKFAIKLSWYILFLCREAPRDTALPAGRQQCCSYKMVLLFLTMAMDDNFLQDKTAAALATVCRGLPNRPACLLPATPPPSAAAAVLELAVSSSSTTQHSWAKLRTSA